MSESNGKRRFKLARKEEAIELENPDGTVEECVLREMDGTERDAWLNSTANRIKFDAAGNPVGGMKMDGFQADLISMCLYRGEARVPRSEIVRYPASLQAELFFMCRDLNALDKKAKEEAKKD